MTDIEVLNEAATYISDLSRALIHGCSDGNCKIRKMRGITNAGMHTNGGCKCHQMPDALFAMAAALEGKIK